MPDGQLCLLALPPECCQGEGPGSMRYLKLFCRYITDRKVAVNSTPAPALAPFKKKNICTLTPHLSLFRG